MKKVLVILACAIAGVFVARYLAFNESEVRSWEVFWHFAVNFYKGGIFRAVLGEQGLIFTILKSGAFVKSFTGFLVGGVCAWCFLLDLKKKEP